MKRMIKIMVYTILTIMGLYLGYVFAETPGMEPETAWTCLIIYCGVLALDVVEFREFFITKGEKE